MGGGGRGAGGVTGGNNQGRGNNAGGAGGVNRNQGMQGATPGRQRDTGPWIDDRHPQIVALMAPYIAKRGPQVILKDILDAAGTRLRYMPTIPEFIGADGRPNLCWAHILGRCVYGRNCLFASGHPSRAQIPDGFAAEVCDLLASGIQEAANRRGYTGGGGGGSPPKKAKLDGDE